MSEKSIEEAEIREPINSEAASEENFEKSHQAQSKKGLYPTLIDLAAIFGVIVISQIVILLLSIFFFSLSSTQLPEAMQQAWLALLAQGALLITILFIHFMRKRRKAEKIKLKLSLKGLNPVILLGGILMILSCSVVIEPLLALLPSPQPIVARGWPLLLSVVFGAPILEEIICRGYIFESLRAKRGVVVALLGSSLFFALIHLDPTMVVNAFFMGMILCYIYIASSSLLAPMIIHAFNNAIAYLLIVMGFGEDTMLRDLVKSDELYYLIYGFAVLILLISIVVSARQFKKILEAKKEEATKAEFQAKENIIEQEA